MKNPDLRLRYDGMAILSYNVVATIVTRMPGWIEQVMKYRIES
jgi:hypothetical protein